jgi:hypothetical protein
VPYLIGNNLEDARNKILGASLNLGVYIFDNTVINYQDSLKALVYRQTPSYDDRSDLQLGSAIYLWLTTDSTKVPFQSNMYIFSDTIPESETIPIQW